MPRGPLGSEAPLSASRTTDRVSTVRVIVPARLQLSKPSQDGFVSLAVISTYNIKTGLFLRMRGIIPKRFYGQMRELGLKI